MLNFMDTRGDPPGESLPSPCQEKFGQCLHSTLWDAPSLPGLRGQPESWQGSPKALWRTVPVERTGYQAVPACSPGSGRGEVIPSLLISSSLDAGTRRDNARMGITRAVDTRAVCKQLSTFCYLIDIGQPEVLFHKAGMFAAPGWEMKEIAYLQEK